MFLLASVSSFLFSCLCYSFMAPRFTSVKQKSWIVTFISSAAMSACSFPFLQDFLSQRGDLLAVRHRTLLARAVCGSFQGFLLSDLAIGNIEYPHHLSPILGWTHHIIYAFILPFVTVRGWSHVFSLCLSMEIPTCLLASSFLWPKLRNDALYVALFFWTRIALHATLLLESILPRGRNGAMGGSFVPACLFLATFIMHARWFMSSAKGTIGRARANSRNGTAAGSQGSQSSGKVSIGSIHIDSTLRMVYFEDTKLANASVPGSFRTEIRK
ncbi:hypothetical protein A7U60_g6002 [Sanghuangporus baumii]|uniref:TLC domain-containing protein n=1 Tax=Sanghuangporus baumii TaxID=108892 RepID=A0A9Q5HVP7_SANBA|nr:hypothetical protein A7U60_g6002 [Sanghuangporus baumii]